MTTPEIIQKHEKRESKPTDCGIDALVYELHKLSEEEIQIGEEK